jgi:hypothetical protein
VVTQQAGPAALGVLTDRNMPSLKIRNIILKLLLQFEEISQETMKIYGIN